MIRFRESVSRCKEAIFRRGGLVLNWLADYAGTICAVLGGIAVAVGATGASYLSFTPIGLAITIGVFAIGAIVSGAYYLGREYGRRTERERQQALREREQEEQIETERARAANYALNSQANLSSELAEDSHYSTMQAFINTIEKRVSFLEGAQSTRFQNESLRELHNERRLNAGQVNFSSDSDSEDANLLSRQSMFPPNNFRNRRPAANDSLGLGVELRHRNSMHK